MYTYTYAYTQKSKFEYIRRPLVGHQAEKFVLGVCCSLVCGVWCLVSLVQCLVDGFLYEIDGFLYEIVLFLAPQSDGDHLRPCALSSWGSPWPASLPASPSQPQPTPSQPSSQPAGCHPVRQKPNPELLQTSRITLQPSKTNENQWFSMVFAMSGWSPPASILDAQGAQIDTK